VTTRLSVEHNDLLPLFSINADYAQIFTVNFMLINIFDYLCINLRICSSARCAK